MGAIRRAVLFSFAVFACLLCAGVGSAAEKTDGALSKEDEACQALTRMRNLTILSAEIVAATDSTPQYCHVRGLISPAIHWHMQLPLPASWNGRLLNIGNGGKAGNLIFADNRVAQGYAVANSNTGHDNGSEPNASFAFDNRQAEIDYGYRAVHVTAVASKTLVKTYYGKDSEYAYFEGCSTGGRQGMMEAQRFPYDFDGIVAGAPVLDFQALNASNIWTLQRMFLGKFSGNLAFDTRGDGSYASLTKFQMLQDAVLAKCDARDGIKDGVIDDPLDCDFNPVVDLEGKMCPRDTDADNCFTRLQVHTIKSLYDGARDSKGVRVLKGRSLGSESHWPASFIPHAGNSLIPSRFGVSEDHINYLFYEKDPGVPMSIRTDLSALPDKTGPLPEVPWWEFSIDDLTSGKADFMKSITDATDPDLTRFLFKKSGKLIIYHGWADAGGALPEATLDYYKNVVTTTFKGDLNATRAKARLFLAPGMEHCGGGPGPNDWDKLAPLVDWVEHGRAPDYVVAVHRSSVRGGGNEIKVTNERKICAYPQRAVYTGPARGQNDPANWIQSNFSCR